MENSKQNNKNILVDLYNGKKQIHLTLNNIHPATVALIGYYDLEPDCKVEVYTANSWFRTTKGINSIKYKTLSALKSALTQIITRKLNMIITEFIIKDVNNLIKYENNIAERTTI